jgi:hypothetical protein
MSSLGFRDHRTTKIEPHGLAVGSEELGERSTIVSRTATHVQKG